MQIPVNLDGTFELARRPIASVHHNAFYGCTCSIRYASDPRRIVIGASRLSMDADIAVSMNTNRAVAIDADRTVAINACSVALAKSEYALLIALAKYASVLT